MKIQWLLVDLNSFFSLSDIARFEHYYYYYL